MGTVVGKGLSLPIDVEPYGPGDSEYAAGQRLLERMVDHVLPTFCTIRGGGWFICGVPIHFTHLTEPTADIR
jgi:hypothetical protein